MFSWVSQKVQEGLSTVAGTAEPIYGPEAIHTVTSRADKEKPYTEVTSEDLKWKVSDYTSVETQTFYLISEGGYFGMAQVIYSNVAGVQTTVQFNAKVWHPTNKDTNVWSSIALNNHAFDDLKTSFYADDVAVVLSEDGGSYKIKSMVDQEALVNITVTRVSPGFKCGPDGRTLYGHDAEQPWGEMKHVFWPRNKVEGNFVIKGKSIDFKGDGLFIHALQGMKPHHAAARWNFCTFQGTNLSAVMMEFTTPPSYGSTKVTVGGLAKDGDTSLGGTVENTAEHVKSKEDEEVNWPEPTEVKFTWKGTTTGEGEKKEVVATLEKVLPSRMDRVDVMHEVPAFVKKIVAGAAGTRPYIYQFFQPATVKLKVGADGEEVEEEGTMFMETTFIS